MEMMVAVSILGVVLTIVYGSLNSGIRTASDSETRAQIQASVRLAADAFVRDVRQAYTGDASLNRISSLAANQLTFYSPDRITPYHIRKISYRMNGTSLERSVTVSSDTDGFPWTFGTVGAYVPVVTDVRNPTLFTYSDQNGNATTNPTAVITIDLTLTVDKDTARTPAAVTYSTTAQMRGATSS